MTYTLDPEILQALLSAADGAPPPEASARGDWRHLRNTVDRMMKDMMEKATLPSDVSVTSYKVTASDSHEIAMRWYQQDGSDAESAVLYLHGGGMISGSLDTHAPYVSFYVANSGIPMLAVDYRLAPEHKYNVPVEDCYAGLEWLVANAETLGIDGARIGLMGDSAGGGLAAGTALLARDRNIAIAKQILIYPMLDDRNTAINPNLDPFATWSYDNNFTGWFALLGKLIGTDEVSPYVAPARALNLSNVAPIYIEVGELDIFRNESLEFALLASRSGVPIELHVHSGAPHGFELFAPQSAVAKRAMADRIRVISSL